MRFGPIAVLTVALLAIGATGASGVSVTPDPDSPNVLLKGQESISPRNQGSPGFNQVDVGPARPLVNGMAGACAGGVAVGACQPDPASPTVDLTAEIRRAVESVGLPALALRIQPGGQTLVNVATIFHTEAPEFRHSTVLLGQAVEITATPARFTWHHGDGTTQTTSTPGAPYPSTAVTHRYARVAAGLAPRVDVGYRVSYRVNGGDVQEIDQLITASGPSTDLAVVEAAPVVVAP